MYIHVCIKLQSNLSTNSRTRSIIEFLSLHGILSRYKVTVLLLHCAGLNLHVMYNVSLLNRQIISVCMIIHVYGHDVRANLLSWPTSGKSGTCMAFNGNFAGEIVMHIHIEFPTINYFSQFDNTTGTLTIAGNATTDVYYTALQQLTYFNK